VSYPTAAADALPRSHGRRARRRPWGQLGIALMFLAPALFGFITFYLWPALQGVFLSFTDWNALSPAKLIGLGNYVRLAQDALFWNSLAVTAEYVVINIGLQTVLAIGLAVLMHRLTRSMVVRGIILLPYMIPNVIVALIGFWMLDYKLGIGNQMLTWMGLDRVPFFGSETWAIPTIAGINVWRHLGYTALLIFAGLQTIPKDLYDASAIDGASEWKMFWRITLPLLRPVLALVLVITIIGSFQIFDTIAVTTKGGPINATRVIYYYIFERAFDQFDFGYAAAMSVVLMLILSGITLLQLRLLRAGESDMS
jgi:multiple sugar transport system permease protein